MSVFKNFSRRKPLAVIKKQELDGDIVPELNLFDVTCIGVGCTVGSGVFVLTGDQISSVGPAAFLSWILAGMVCLATALCYMELSSFIPTRGSCYIYAYHALGEVAAVVAAACLTLEYGISGAGVARTWSAGLAEIISPDDLSWSIIRWGDDPESDYYIDILAGLVMFVAFALTLIGFGMGKIVVNLFTLAKILLVLFMIVAGFVAWSTPEGYGVEQFESWESFAPSGIAGILLGTTRLFFGFIGFDEVSVLSSRTYNAEKNIPWAIAGTLIIVTIISALAQLSLTGIASEEDLAEGGYSETWNGAFSYIGWGWIGQVITIGQSILLPIVVYLIFIAQPELNSALATDGLMPKSFNKSNKLNVLIINNTVSGIILTLIAACVPFSVIWDVVSLGVLFSFNIVDLSVLAVHHSPDVTPAFCIVSFVTFLCTLLSAFCIWPFYFGPYFDEEYPDCINGLLETGEPCPTSVTDWTLNPDTYEYEFSRSHIWWISGLALLVVSLLISFVYIFLFRKKAREDVYFITPLVPFIPIVAMFLNNFLIAQISFINLAIFAGYLVLSVVIYMVGSCFKSNDDVWDDDEFRLDASDDEANVDGKIFTGQNNLVTDGAKNKEDPMMTSSVVLHDNDLDF